MDAIVKQAISADKPKPLRAILWGGLVCGVLDITAALVVYGRLGLRADSAAARDRRRIAGAAGPRGRASRPRLLGLLLHFFIAFCSGRCLRSRRAAGLASWFGRPCFPAILYGVAVYFFMNRIVVPLSAARTYPFSFRDDGHRRRHTHLLRRAAHRYHGAAILMTDNN